MVTLSTEQRAFVHADPHRPVIGLFPAGGGKTTSLVERAGVLAAHQPAGQGIILTTTYSRRAAGELEQRLAARFGAAASARLWARTLHSTGLWLLAGPPDMARRYLEVDGRIKIADEWQQRQAAHTAARRHGVQAPVAALRRDLSLYKVGARPRATGLPSVELAAVCREYDRVLHGRGYIDYDDMVALPFEAMRRHRPALREARDLITRLAVDEAQDLSYAETCLVAALGGTQGERLSLVGDVRQSINQFRGSDERNFLELARRLPGVHIVRVATSHRLTRQTARLANPVGRAIMGPADTPIEAASDGEAPVLYLGPDGLAEANYVAHTARRLLDMGLVSQARDIAVLYRERAQAPPLRTALERYHVPVQPAAGTSAGARAALRTILAWLALYAGTAVRRARAEVTGLGRLFAHSGGVWSIGRRPMSSPSAPQRRSRRALPRSSAPWRPLGLRDSMNPRWSSTWSCARPASWSAFGVTRPHGRTRNARWPRCARRMWPPSAT